MTNEVIPIIDCQPAGMSGDTPQWKFRCPHCRTYHHHGGEPDGDGIIGHRCAHCYVDSSPLRATGYVLRVAR
jgi:hypothetical protein